MTEISQNPIIGENNFFHHEMKQLINIYFNLNLDIINEILNDLKYVITGTVISRTLSNINDYYLTYPLNNLHFIGHNENEDLNRFKNIMRENGYKLEGMYRKRDLENVENFSIINYLPSKYLPGLRAYRFKKDIPEELYSDDELEIFFFKIANANKGDYNIYDNIVKYSFFDIFRTYSKRENNIDELVHIDFEYTPQLNRVLPEIMIKKNILELEDRLKLDTDIYYDLGRYSDLTIRDYIESLYKLYNISTFNTEQIVFKVKYSRDFENELFRVANNINIYSIKIIFSYIWNYYMYLFRDIYRNFLNYFIYIDTSFRNRIQGQNNIMKLYTLRITPFDSVEIPFDIENIYRINSEYDIENFINENTSNYITTISTNTENINQLIELQEIWDYEMENEIFADPDEDFNRNFEDDEEFEEDSHENVLGQSPEIDEEQYILDTEKKLKIPDSSVDTKELYKNLVAFINKYFFNQQTGLNMGILRDIINRNKQFINDPKCKMGIDLISYEEFNNRPFIEIFNEINQDEDEQNQKLIGMINSVNNDIYCFILSQEYSYWGRKLDSYSGFILNTIQELEDAKKRYYRGEDGLRKDFLNFSVLSNTFFIRENLKFLKFNSPLLNENNIYLYIPTTLRWIDANPVAVGAFHNYDNNPPGDILHLIVPFDLFEVLEK